MMNKIKNSPIKIIGIIKTSIHIIKLEYKMNRKTFLHEIIQGLSENSSSVLKVILPALLIDLILKSNQFNKILWVITIFSLLLTILAIVQKNSRLLQIANSYKTSNLFNLELNKKSLRLDYEDIEDPKILDVKDNAIESLWSFLEVDYIVFNEMLGSFLNFMAMTYIIAKLNIFILCFVFFISNFKYNFRIQTNTKNSLSKQNGGKA